MRIIIEREKGCTTLRHSRTISVWRYENIFERVRRVDGRDDTVRYGKVRHESTHTHTQRAQPLTKSVKFSLHPVISFFYSIS